MNSFPFIVKLHNTFQTSKKIYFVLDFIDGGDLLFHLSKAKGYKFTE